MEGSIKITYVDTCGHEGIESGGCPVNRDSVHAGCKLKSIAKLTDGDITHKYGIVRDMVDELCVALIKEHLMSGADTVATNGSVNN